VRQFLWLALLSTPTRYGGPSLWRTWTMQSVPVVICTLASVA